MPKQPRLMNRKGRWVYRVRVPDILAPGIGKREIWKSFGAVSHEQASRMGRLEGVRIDALLEEERARLRRAGTLASPSPASSQEDIYRAVRTFFHGLEKGAGPVPFDDGAREDALDVAISEASAVHSVTVEDASIQATAMVVATEARLTFERGSPLFWELVSAVKQALDEHHVREVERLSLQPVANRHRRFADITAATPPRRTMTLAEAVAAFKAAPEKSDRSPKTRAAWDFRFAAWEDLLGSGKRVSEISRKDIQNARDILLVVPPNAAKRWPKKSLTKVVDIARRDKLAPMHPKSVQLYLETLTSLLKWLVAEGELDANPAVGVGAPSANLMDQPRRPLTVPEIQRLFMSGPFAPPIKERDWRFWVPLIALFQGMRIAEIVGLAAADVSDRDGVQVFVVRPNSARPLKTAQSARLVPVHPTLALLGFAAYVKTAPPTGPLFTGLPGKGEDPGNAAQKAIARWVRGVFPNDEAVVFHSLRHTWTDALRNAYVPREIMERLGGWKPSGGSAMHGYGDGFRPSVLATEIAKVTHPDLNLVHLHPATNA